jgi:predicted nucleotidyltransferase component of viral defense system
MLAGIYAHEDLTENWVFKGGTCLKKCFFETYRFSEDLDFTLLKPEHLDAGFLKGTFSEIGEWIYEETGIEIPPKGQEFEIYRNPRGQLSCQGRISYRGPISPTPLPRIKLDLTADERVVLPHVQTHIFHPYTDRPERGIEVLAYDYIEAFAEKFRALAERTRPRDLYDVVNLYRNGEARPEPRRFMEVLRAKCEFKGIRVPRIGDLNGHRADLEAGWAGMLEHQLPALLPVATFWDALPEIFAWLEGAVAQPLAAMRMGSDETLIRDRVVGLAAGSRGQNFVEMIRFAAANRLLVEIDYRDKQGNRATREVEAYSLRRSQTGDVLLMAVRVDNGESRSYLVDSILGVRTTQTSFSPRFPIELTPSGPQSIPHTTSSVAGGGLDVRNTPVLGRSSGRRTARSSSLAGASGPTYVFKCSACGKSFNKKTYDGTLNKHKDSRTRYECYGTFGTYVRTKY